ncbi:DUF2384 domain-containing protein [Polaromonas glacialis]|uniref:DUF2384 domain-containing protein n=1 Tax=Polaromonas glacialis TaxID=866564 RepID=UPI00055B3D77|nr:DUF2384 domain-containing protein [Polaromonas glacialis]
MLTAALQPSPALSHGFDGFIAFLHDPQAGASTLSPKRFSDVLSIDLQTLATQAHVHRNTIHRAPASESVQKFLREALRVLRAATDLCGDVGRAIFWYRNEPLPPFGYQTAEQLVTQGRTDDVLRYVESLEAGAAG